MARKKLTRNGDDGPSSLEGTMSHVTLMVDPTELKLRREHSAKIAIGSVLKRGGHGADRCLSSVRVCSKSTSSAFARS